MANYQELANLVWNVADDVLRGLFKPHEYGDVTLPFLVLRRLDCILEEGERKRRAINAYNQFKDKVSEDRLPPIILKATGTQFYNTSQYDLARLKDEPANIRHNFQNYLNGFSADVRDIIENFNLDRFIERLDRNNRLFIFCSKFTEVDLHPNKVDNHIMGQVFEELLRRFSEMSNETSGEHYTPRDVVQLLVSLLFAEHRENLQGQGVVRSIFDPCCGTGTIILEAAQMGMIAVGYDINVRMVGATRKNLEHYGLSAEVCLGDARHVSGRYDAVVTDFPYGIGLARDTTLDREILERIRELSPRAVFVHTRDLRSELTDLGYHIEKAVPARKHTIVRTIFITSAGS